MGYTFFNGRMNGNQMVGSSSNNNGASNRNTYSGPGGFSGTFNGSQTGLNNGHQNEFSTPNCNDLNVYHFGKQIGHGAYAVVKECVHKPSGEKVAIK